MDGPGKLVVVDSSNNRLRVVARRTAHFYGADMTVGDGYTVAGTGASGFSGDGSSATSAEHNLPNGVAVDAAGDLLVADSLNNRVRAMAVTDAFTPIRTAFRQAFTGVANEFGVRRGSASLHPTPGAVNAASVD